MWKLNLNFIPEAVKHHLQKEKKNEKIQKIKKNSENSKMVFEIFRILKQNFISLTKTHEIYHRAASLFVHTQSQHLLIKTKNQL